MLFRGIRLVQLGTNYPPNIIHLPASIITVLGVEQKQSIKIKLGNWAIDAVVMQANPTETRFKVLKMGKNIFDEFPLCPNLKLNIKLNSEDKSLSIGPVLGFFTVKLKRGKNFSGMQDPYIQALNLMSKSVDVLSYVFTPQDIDMKNNQVKGYHLTDKGWKQRSFPLPDVIYDRIASRTNENKKEVKQAKEYLFERCSFYFNPRFLNKWDVHQFLKNNQVVKNILPETAWYKGVNQIDAFLKKYSTVYLKPNSGSLGLGIIRISYKGDKYNYKYKSRVSGQVSGITDNLNDLKEIIKKVAKGRLYIIQQGLILKSYLGRFFDLRILMQKNGQGRWCRTKMFARVAQSGSITSNVSGGADAIGLKTLGKICGTKNIAHLRRLGANLAIALEREMGTILGELGLDLGVDVNGKIWLIEVNSRPYKKIEDLDLITTRRSIIRPLSFARYLWLNSAKILS